MMGYFEAGNDVAIDLVKRVLKRVEVKAAVVDMENKSGIVMCMPVW